MEPRNWYFFQRATRHQVLFMVVGNVPLNRVELCQVIKVLNSIVTNSSRSITIDELHSVSSQVMQSHAWGWAAFVAGNKYISKLRGTFQDVLISLFMWPVSSADPIRPVEFGYLLSARFWREFHHLMSSTCKLESGSAMWNVNPVTLYTHTEFLQNVAKTVATISRVISSFMWLAKQ
jgi:hypothetical protein